LHPSARASKPFTTAAFALVAGFVVGASLIIAFAVESAGAQDSSACTGEQVYPDQDLAQVAADSPKGTTFCMHDGTYNVSVPVRVEGNDRFIGLYNDPTRPAVVTTKAQQVFNAGPSDGAVIEGLRISGAVGGNHCEPACGRGIQGGKNLTVRNVRITGNMNNGIGGTSTGLRVENSRIDHNGSYSFTLLDGHPSTAAGIKSSQTSLTVVNSRIDNNYWNGVWCDNDCEAVTVKDSTITGNGKAGIHAEILSGPAVFSGNTIIGNGTLADANHPSGLLIVSSSNVDAYNNTFGNNRQHGVRILDDGRAPGIKNVEIRENAVNGDTLHGCELSGVSCQNNN
jgi:hypothetical protein